MKKKIIAVILLVLLLVLMMQVAFADSSGICFTAVNDQLLDVGSMAASVGGVVYVPANVFSPVGVYYQYFSSDSTALLLSGNTQIFFDLTNGNAYDSNEEYYSASAAFVNGQVYVPAVWVCTYFGLSCSYIRGSGYGDVMRIKNANVVLTDSQFMDAASSTMKNRYNELFGTSSSPTPKPSQPAATETPEDNNASVSLSFVGIPSDKLLNSLDIYSYKVCFFVTAEEVEANPDAIRKICGLGHTIGIYCEASPEAECEAATDLIFKTAQTRPTLLTSAAAISTEAELYADDNGYAYFSPAIAVSEDTKYSYSITTQLQKVNGYTSMLVPINDNTDTFISYVLQFVASRSFSVMQLRETMV